MRALIRWAIASVGSLCLFAAVWALCHYVIGLDNVTSLTWASAFLLVAITALGFWAGRNSAPPSPTAGQTNTANATGDNSQAIAGNSNIVLRAIRDSTVNITASPPAPRTRVSAASDGAAVVGDVPQRPPSFQSRNDLLALLRKHTHEPGTCAVHAVTGMPGAGKTQLVAAYARECITGKWRFVGWINADTDASILNRLSQATAALGIAPGDTQEDTARAVRHHLESNGERCLVVFDNASSPDALRPYLPATGAAHIVITSTLQSVSSLGTPIAVDAFTPAESLAYLHERTGNSDDHGARELAAELGHLPLALAHAAAVIKAQQISYPTYLERLRALPIDCYLMRPHEDPYPRSTAAAILLSLRTAQDTDATALAAPLLGIIALLSSTGVPRRVLHTAPALIPGFHPRSPTQPAQASTGIPRGIALQAGVDAALAHVCDASLLIPSIDGSVFRAHRLTMRIIREHNSHDGTFPAITAAAINVLQVARQATEPIWQHAATARDLTLQITALCHHLPLTCRSASDEVTQALIQLRTWAVYCLNELRDNWPEAIRLGEQPTSDLEQLLGPDHPGTLTSKSNLANAYLGAGQFNQAVTLHEHTLAEREKILAPDHPDILSSRSNLAAARGGPVQRRHPPVRARPGRPEVDLWPQPPGHPRIPKQPRGHIPRRRTI